MKKLLPSAVLALVVSGMLTAQSFAGCCFGLCTRKCGCCGCGAKFCVRQYNAFSPVCCGTVFCDGCCPFGACGGGGYGGGPCMGGMCGAGGCGLPFSGLPAGACGAGGCGGYLGSLPPSDPGTALPPDGAPMPPATTASPMPAGTTGQIINDRPIQNASYRPAPVVMPVPVVPMQMQPQTMAAPAYWGN